MKNADAKFWRDNNKCYGVVFFNKAYSQLFQNIVSCPCFFGNEIMRTFHLFVPGLSIEVSREGLNGLVALTVDG